MSDERKRGAARTLRSAAALLIGAACCVVAGCSTVPGDPSLYKTYCAACHGAGGEGLRSLYPPLRGSAYLGRTLDQLPCLITRGAGDSIRMPAFPQLTTAQITDLILFMDHAWGMGRDGVSEQAVAAWLASCR